MSAMTWACWGSNCANQGSVRRSYSPSSNTCCLARIGKAQRREPLHRPSVRACSSCVADVAYVVERFAFTLVRRAVSSIEAVARPSACLVPIPRMASVYGQDDAAPRRPARRSGYEHLALLFAERAAQYQP
jgi:hypothetical protein